MNDQHRDNTPAPLGDQNKRARTLADLLCDPQTHVVDGAWGTLLFRRGLDTGQLPEAWNLERPDAVREVAALYHRAGAAWVGTNSFNGNPLRLAVHGLQARAGTINRLAAQFSREAVGAKGLVMGTLGPTGVYLQDATFPEARLADAYRRQAEALLEGGADALMIETLLDPREAACALRALRGRAALCCSFSFAEDAPSDFKTLRGTPVDEAIRMAVGEGACVVGANCTLDPEGMARLAPALLSAAGDTPVILRPNAGQPHELESGLEYPVEEAAFGAFATRARQLGVRFIGGCCGTTPDTIRAMRRAVAAGA